MKYDESIKKGSKIRCIDNGGCSFLTVGKVYDVLSASAEYFKYLDDDGTELKHPYEMEIFKLVEEDEMQTNNQVKPDEFRVGDTVWDVVYGKGHVVDIEHLGDATYPVKVYFDDGFSEYYTEDGKCEDSGNRTLFFSEPKVEASVTRPFVPTLVGKKVVVVPKFNKNNAEVITIADEDEERVYITEAQGHYWTKKDLVGIYEVQSENLLKS